MVDFALKSSCWSSGGEILGGIEIYKREQSQSTGQLTWSCLAQSSFYGRRTNQGKDGKWSTFRMTGKA